MHGGVDSISNVVVGEEGEEGALVEVDINAGTILVCVFGVFFCVCFVCVLCVCCVVLCVLCCVSL